MKSGLLLLFLTLPATTQNLAHAPPLFRLTQVPGAALFEPLRQADGPAGVNVLGMTATTGSAETWSIETHGSFAGLEQFDEEHPAIRGNPQRSTTLIAFYRHWWSNRPDEAVLALRKARYVQVSLYRIAVGAEANFAELLRARQASLDSINLDRPDMVYQVLAGAPSGTFLILSPLPSLKVLDDGVSRSAAAYLRSTGSPSNRSGGQLALQSELSHENLLFKIEPSLSSVSDDFASLDAAFWKSAKP